MKKSLLALAVLGAFAGAASAQSSVTLFGIVDLSAQVRSRTAARAAPQSLQSNQHQQQPSRLPRHRRPRRRPEGRLLARSGDEQRERQRRRQQRHRRTSNGTSIFNRRSTVSLYGNWGEIRLGRDYDADVLEHTVFDAFGTNGLGQRLEPRSWHQQHGELAGSRQRHDRATSCRRTSAAVYGQAQVSAPSEQRVHGQRWNEPARSTTVAVSATPPARST